MKNPFGIVRKCLQAHMGLFAIRDEEGHRLAEDLSEAEADFLVAAINNHEKLVEVCGKAREILADTIIPMGINKKGTRGNNTLVLLDAAFAVAE